MPILDPERAADMGRRSGQARVARGLEDRAARLELRAKGLLEQAAELRRDAADRRAAIATKP